MTLPTSRRFAGAFAVTVVLALLGVAVSPMAANADPVGLSLTVVGSDTSTVAGDTSVSNHDVPTGGGAVTYRWAWSDAGAASVPFSQTLPPGMAWDPASVSAGCSLSGDITVGHTLDCVIGGLVIGATGSVDKVARVWNIASGSTVSSTLHSHAAMSSATFTAVGATRIGVRMITAEGSIDQLDPNAPQTDWGQLVTYRYVLQVPESETEGTKGVQSLQSPVAVPVTIPAAGVVQSCNGVWATNGVEDITLSTASCSAGFITFSDFDSSYRSYPKSGYWYDPEWAAFAAAEMKVWIPNSAITSTGDFTATAGLATATGLDGTTVSSAATSTFATLSPAVILPVAVFGGLSGYSTNPYPGAIVESGVVAYPPSGPGAPAGSGIEACTVWNPVLATLQAAPNAMAAVQMEFGTVAYADEAARATADCGTAGDGNAAWYPTYSGAAAAPGGFAAITAVRMTVTGTISGRTDLPLVRLTATTSTAVMSGTPIPLHFSYDADQHPIITRNTQTAVFQSASVRVSQTADRSTLTGGERLTMTLKPVVSQPVPTVTDGRNAVGVTVTTQLPDGCLSFVPAGILPLSVVPVVPADPLAGETCRQVPGQVITWNLGDVPTTQDVDEPQIVFYADLAERVPAPYTLVIDTMIASASDATNLTGQSDSTSVNTTAIAQLWVDSSATVSHALPDVPFSYTYNWYNGMGIDLGQAYVVTTLPDNDDGRGTAGIPALTLGAVATSPASYTIEYTTDALAGVRSALAGDSTGSSGISWSTTKPVSGVTAIRFGVAAIVNGAEGTATVEVTPLSFGVGASLVTDFTLTAVGAAPKASTPLTVSSAVTTLSGRVLEDSDYSYSSTPTDVPIAATLVNLAGYAFGPNGIDDSGDGDDVDVSRNLPSTGTGAYSFDLVPGLYDLSSSVGGLVQLVTAGHLVQAGTPHIADLLFQQTLAVPSLTADSARVSQGAIQSIPITVNDASLGAPAGGVPASTITLSTPAFGSVQLIGDNAFYTAAAQWPVAHAGQVTYTDTFSYTVTNAQNAQRTATATVTVIALPAAANDGAVNRIVVPQAGSTTILPLGNDVGDVLKITGHGGAPLGTVAVRADGLALIYTPGAHHGDDQFSYQVTDSMGKTATATVYVAVITTPVAADDGSAGSPIAVPMSARAIAVLANDSGTTISITSIPTLPLHGVAAITGTQVTYTPDAAYTGTDSFEYEITDSAGATSRATAYLRVVADPTTNADFDHAEPGDILLIDVLANDVVSNAATLTSVSSPGAGNGTASIVGGAVRFEADGVGTQTFSYLVTESTGQTTTGIITVLVAVAVVAVELDIAPGTAANAPGNTIVVSGDGLRIGSTVEVVMHSDPVLLMTVTIGPSGSFMQTLSLPFTIPAGSHTVIVTGVAPSGTAVSQSTGFSLAAPVLAGSSLAVTGTQSPIAVSLIAAMMVLVGVLLAIRRRRRRAH